MEVPVSVEPHPLSPERAAEVLAALRGPIQGYPEAAVAQASAHVAQLEPELLAVLEAYATDVHAAEADYGGMAPIFAAYLLGHARCTAAHPLLLRILALPDEDPDEAFGDLVTEDMPLLLWQTCGGDLSGVIALAGERDAYLYSRTACLAALPYAWAEGALQRAEAVATLQELLASAREPPDDGFFVSQVVSGLCDLHPAESMELLRETFALDLVLTFWMDWDSVLDAAGRALEPTLEELRGEHLAKLSLTPHDHLHWWAAFGRDDGRLPLGRRNFGQPTSGGEEQRRKERNKRKAKKAKKARSKKRK